VEVSPLPSKRLHGDLARYYDQDAEARAARPIDVERVRRRDRFVELLAVRGLSRVLEVGMGPGVDAIALAEAGLSVAGIDLSPEHVRLAREAGVDGYVASAQAIPFDGVSFDALWSVSVLMHMPDQDLHQALAEFARVLRPGGLAALGMWGGDGSEGVNAHDKLDPPRYFNWRTDRAMRAAIADHATVEEFESWVASGSGGRDFRYQWCVARFGDVPSGE
jgi:SAM-dependent methyltransferase